MGLVFQGAERRNGQEDTRFSVFKLRHKLAVKVSMFREWSPAGDLLQRKGGASLTWYVWIRWPTPESLLVGVENLRQVADCSGGFQYRHPIEEVAVGK